MKLKLKHKASGGNKELKCAACRHSNQSTVDFADGLIFCKHCHGIKIDSECDQPITFMDGEEYFLFEKYDGRNCTWRSEETMEITR